MRGGCGRAGAGGTSAAARGTYRLPAAVGQLVHAALHALVVEAAADGGRGGGGEWSQGDEGALRRKQSAPAAPVQQLAGAAPGRLPAPRQLIFQWLRSC